MLQTVFNTLKTYWQPQSERCGVVLRDNIIVELENTHPNPQNNFSISTIPADAAAVWHTHPSGDCNLSVEDYHTFKQHPNLIHIIIGNSELAYYYIDVDGEVIRGEDDAS